MNLQGDSIRSLTRKKAPLAAEKNVHTADGGREHAVGVF